MANKSHALAAGIFVLVVAAMLAGLAIWLTRDSANYEQYELSTKDGVSGLQPQAAVRYKGVAVGKVTRIGFDPQVTGNVLIRIAVNEQAPISPTTFAVLGYQGVTGLAHVLPTNLTPSCPRAPAVCRACPSSRRRLASSPSRPPPSSPRWTKPRGASTNCWATPTSKNSPKPWATLPRPQAA